MKEDSFCEGRQLRQNAGLPAQFGTGREDIQVSDQVKLCSEREIIKDTLNNSFTVTVAEQPLKDAKQLPVRHLIQC